ncbi:hypothetical protein F2Q69_00030872 [Brassica cretica]|uniref:Flavodoxin-like domain-containing protein n=1 Tax=Brassica cretica TaxID=69181 RepID=A0A8S9S702_BRACR|nr:hypothetical protein F2Q69_00030872 [Brassica cretica]
MGEKQRKLLVLYASQTGNALDAAERIGREAERRGCPASIVSTDEFDPVCARPNPTVRLAPSAVPEQGTKPDDLGFP